MKEWIPFFAELGERLRPFGRTPQSRETIAQACRANGWFRPEEIVRAVETIRRDMLDAGKLESWSSRYALPAARPRRVLVVMAGNIPLVGFFDLLCVVASGHRCAVKPSGKDRILMEYVVRTMREIDPAVPVELCGGATPADAVIATGSNNAARYFRARYAEIPTLLRGSRQSAAVLSGAETPAQLAGLADDIWAYSGLGCRNVSLLFLPEGYTPALTMPAMNAKYRNNYRQQRALCEMEGQPFVDLGCAVAVEQQEFPQALSLLSLARYRSLDEVERWLAAHDRQLQCVVSECLSHSRRTDFGRAQSPALTDYPDDCDVMEFLSGI